MWFSYWDFVLRVTYVVLNILWGNVSSIKGGDWYTKISDVEIRLSLPRVSGCGGVLVLRYPLPHCRLVPLSLRHPPPSLVECVRTVEGHKTLPALRKTVLSLSDVPFGHGSTSYIYHALVVPRYTSTMDVDVEVVGVDRVSSPSPTSQHTRGRVFASIQCQLVSRRTEDLPSVPWASTNRLILVTETESSVPWVPYPGSEEEGPVAGRGFVNGADILGSTDLRSFVLPVT